MVMECKCGQMEPVMRGIGNIIKHAGKASSGMWMAMCLRDSGKMTKPMGTEFIFT